ncbi:MAG: hypothetical protein JWP89_2343 [Schlesneria sp.]|nr:hypothetical protein [Schlesneria sp.]
MRLIQLSSSKPSFKTVPFNRTGLSLVVGKHTPKQSKNIQSTYNGVGKSLLIALLHFCLGASKNKQFETHLKGWDFTLVFEHNDIEHRITRTVGEDKLVFDGTELRLATYKTALDQLGIFELPADVSTLSFRSLVSFFLRPTKGSYVSPEAAIPQWTPYYKVLYQSFLLGLDYYRVIQKHDAKKKLDEQLTLAKKYKEDTELREFYLGEKNAEMEVASLKERIAKLESDLSNFTVAKDYSDREVLANDLRSSIADSLNEEAVLQARIADVELSMTLNPDVTPDRVKRLYREAEIALPNLIKKRLDEVDAFHTRLRDNRLRRLQIETDKFNSELTRLQGNRAALERDLDNILQYLKAHRALDEYTENNRFLASLTARLRKIEDYLTLLDKYTNEAQRIRVDMSSATVQTTEELKAMKPHLELLMETFRGYAKEFYGDKPAGLVVRNNDSDDNQIRYDIDARIEHDAADGINNVRIFCFDLLLLILHQRHDVNFLFHDSRLFAEMDWHQRLTLFRLADELAQKYGLQYIATINEDQIEPVRTAAGKQFDRLFNDSRILELTDEPGGQGKLLGVQIEMKYGEEP